MFANVYKACIMIISFCLIFAGVCHSRDKEAEATGSKITVAASGTAEKKDKNTSEDKDTGLFDQSGLVDALGDEIHEVLKAERSAALTEVDKERLDTLDYLTRERKATMIELEAIGNRIAENATIKAEGLVDHVFVRALQLGAAFILALFIMGIIFIRIIMQKISQL